jgi:putative Mn2+ efflux pump MntP
VLALAAAKLHADLALPLAVTALFLMACLTAMLAWLHGRDTRQVVSYWDVAGALIFIGIGAAALIDPDQLVRIVADQDR